MATGSSSENPAEFSISSSSKKTGSEGSFERSQEVNGDDVLQRRSYDHSSETSGPKCNVQLGYSDGIGNMLANPPSMAPQTIMAEKPTNLVGTDYWSGPETISAMPAEQEMLRSQYVPGGLAPSVANLAFGGGGSDGGSTDLWLQDDREAKRQKRKQANRESAMRSRMHKQAEFDELAAKVESLTAENNSLKLDMDRLGNLCKKLSSDNNAMREKMLKLEGPGNSSDFVNE